MEPVGSNTSSQVNQKEAGAVCITKRPFMKQRVQPAAGYQPGSNDLAIVFSEPRTLCTPSAALSPRVVRRPVEAGGAAAVIITCHLNHSSSSARM